MILAGATVLAVAYLLVLVKQNDTGDDTVHPAIVWQGLALAAVLIVI